MKLKISGNDDPNKGFNKMDGLTAEFSVISDMLDGIILVEGQSDKRFYGKHIFLSIQTVEISELLDRLKSAVDSLKNLIDKARCRKPKKEEILNKAKGLKDILKDILNRDFKNAVENAWKMIGLTKGKEDMLEYVTGLKGALEGSLEGALKKACEVVENIERNVSEEDWNNAVAQCNCLKKVLDDVVAEEKNLKESIEKIQTVEQGSKDKIISAIENKGWEYQSQKKEPHFYGIIDRDYEPEKKEDELKVNELENHIWKIDAHSLETMLIKYAKDKKEYFKDVFENCRRRKTYECKCLTGQEIEELTDEESDAIDTIYETALDMTLQIGRLRKAKALKRVKDYIDFRKLVGEHYSCYVCRARPKCMEKSECCKKPHKEDDKKLRFYSEVIGDKANNFFFDRENYIRFVLKGMGKCRSKSKHGEIENIMTTSENNEIPFNICQGHDFVYIIGQMFAKLKDIDYEPLFDTFGFIDAFNDDWFKDTDMCRWLENIEGDALKSENDNSVRYRNMIIPVSRKK